MNSDEETARNDFETRTFLVRALLFPVVLTVAVALANGVGRAIGIGDNPAFIFALVCPFGVFWFWLTEVKWRGKAGREGERTDVR